MVFKEQNVLGKLIHTLHVNINYFMHVAVMILEQAAIVFHMTIRRFIIEFARNICVIKALSLATFQYFFFLVHALGLHDIEEELMEEKVNMKAQ